MSKEMLLKQKQNYEAQFKGAETRLQQLTSEVEKTTVQREQLRGAIYALEQVLVALEPPTGVPSEPKALEVVKDEPKTQEQVN